MDVFYATLYIMEFMWTVCSYFFCSCLFIFTFICFLNFVKCFWFYEKKISHVQMFDNFTGIVSYWELKTING